MMFDFTEDVPGPERRNSWYWRAFSTEARQYPGLWAKVATYETSKSASTRASNLNQKPPVSMRPKGAFESVSRGKDVWTRYVGDDRDL